MANKSTFLYGIDEDKVSNLLSDTDENSKYFTRITNQIVDSYTSDLSEIMDQLYGIINGSADMTDQTIEEYMLKLANTIYYVGDRLEIVGIKADVAKAAKQEIYNEAYLNNQVKDSDKRNKTTVAENVATAEAASQYESVIQAIYERTYKIIKFKIDAAQEMLSTLKKICSRRMQELDLSSYNIRGNSQLIKNEE